jgi:hypothetical protein
MTTGRNFDEIVRVLDSIQLTAKHRVTSPENWITGRRRHHHRGLVLMGRRKDIYGLQDTEAVVAHDVATPIVAVQMQCIPA